MKQRVRADIVIDTGLLKLIEKAEGIRGIEGAGFFADTSGTMRGPNGVLWLVYEYDDGDDAAFSNLHDLLVKGTDGMISLKNHGVRYEPGDAKYKEPKPSRSRT